MMKKINSKLVIELIIIASLILALSSTVFADPVIIGGNNVNTQTEVNTTVNNVPNVISNSTSNTTSYNKINTNTNTTLPKTGVTDGYVVAILVTVCAISAIYAYRKIRDYNL